MNILTHKGYTARIHFDDRDGVFVGRVLGLRDIVSFHADSVARLRTAFKAAVEDYLADCEERGVSPEKPSSGKLLLRVPPEVHGQAMIAAQAAGKSLNQWVADALTKAVAESG
jgi:predicted HicB family RNase H-like nuclease